MQQSRTMSVIETSVNVGIGLIVSWLVTFYGLPLFGIDPSVKQATGITFCYFIISSIRSYSIRRVFVRLGDK